MPKRTFPPDSVEAYIRRHGNPIYGSDPELPGLIVRENPDGSRERGRLIGRRFYSIGEYRELGELLADGVPITTSLRLMQIKNEGIVWIVCDTFAHLWQLSDTEKHRLIGTRPKDDDVPLTQAQFERFADLLGIFEALHNLYPDDKMQAAFLRRSHVDGPLKGSTPLEIMLASSDGPRRVASMLLSAAQGWN
jgi:hypothetical protein